MPNVPISAAHRRAILTVSQARSFGATLESSTWSHTPCPICQPISFTFQTDPFADHFSIPPASILMQTCLCLPGLLQQCHFCILPLLLSLLPILNMTASGTTLSLPLLLYFSPLLSLSYYVFTSFVYYLLLPAESKLPEGSSLCFFTLRPPA